MDQHATRNILDAARKRFAEQGYEGTSIRQIAAEANVNVAMISYYFGGKEQLFEKIVDERLGELARRSADVVATQTDVKTAMFAILDAYIDEMLDHPDEYRMINRELSTPNRGEASQLIYRKVSALTGMHLHFVKKGYEQKLIKPVDFPMVMISVIGMLFHILNAHSVVLPMLRNEVPDPERRCPACDFTVADKARLRNHVRHLFENYVFTSSEPIPHSA